MPAYLDYAATAPMRPAARDAWLAGAAGPANPASLHGSGRRASLALEDAREEIAVLAGVSAPEVVLTSGGTESNAIALRGLAMPGRRVLVGATEHKSVLDTARALPDVIVEVLPVDPDGRLRADSLASALGPDVALVAVMAANNETGAVNDVETIGELCARAGARWHCDAVQWAATRDVRRIPADTIALSAHKVGGPVGNGALLVRRGVVLPVYSHGGGQEAGIRSGTVDVAGALAFAAAWSDADRARGTEAARIRSLRDDLQRGIRQLIPDAVVNATGDRLDSHLNATFPGCPADALLMLLDARGVEVSTGSACTAGIAQASHVLLAMGLSLSAARESVRFSLGWATTAADIDAALGAIPEAVARARRAGAVAGAR